MQTTNHKEDDIQRIFSCQSTYRLIIYIIAFFAKNICEKYLKFQH